MKQNQLANQSLMLNLSSDFSMFAVQVDVKEIKDRLDSILLNPSDEFYPINMYDLILSKIWTLI